jgi:hypothetical protein
MSDLNLEELALRLERRWAETTWRSYAKALSQRGDLLGELIEAELDGVPQRKAWDDWLEVHLEGWLGSRLAAWIGEEPVGMIARPELDLEWRFGHLHSATLDLRERRCEARGIIEELLASPAARFMRSLTVIGASAEALRELRRRQRPALRELTIGVHHHDVHDELADPLGFPIDELEPLEVLTPTLESAARLRSLTVFGDTPDLTGCDHEHLTALTLVCRRCPELAPYLRLSACKEIHILVREGAPPERQLASLAGLSVAASGGLPALRRLTIGGEGIAALIPRLCDILPLEQLEELVISAPLSVHDARALAERREKLAQLKFLDFPYLGADADADADPWLLALSELVTTGEGHVLHFLRERDRCRALFFVTSPGMVCFEWLQRSEGPGVGAVVIARRNGLAPEELLEAFFSLAGYWRRTASQGWIGAGAPEPVDMEAAWSDLTEDLLERRIYRPRAVHPDRFVEALDRSLSLLRSGLDLRVVRDNRIDLPDPVNFHPLDEPVLEALALVDEWNEVTFVAATASRSFFHIWSTSA